MLEEILLGSRFAERGFFRKEAVSALLKRHLFGGEDLGGRLWSLLILELWFRRFIDGEKGAFAESAPAAAEVSR